MARHKQFADAAGYTQHCWECVHAKDWAKDSVNGDNAMCEVTGVRVYKYDSPNNQCCHLPISCRYETQKPHVRAGSGGGLMSDFDFNDAVRRTIAEQHDRITALERENAELRELVRDMWRDGMCECDERGACAECEYHFPDRMCELGVEVDE